MSGSSNQGVISDLRGNGQKVILSYKGMTNHFDYFNEIYEKFAEIFQETTKTNLNTRRSNPVASLVKTTTTSRLNGLVCKAHSTVPRKDNTPRWDSFTSEILTKLT